MKYFKLSFIFICAIIFHSCLSSSKADNGEAINGSGTATNGIENQEDSYKMENSKKRLHYFYVKDTRNGMVIERLPFPETWQQHTNGEFAYTGPNGVKVYGEKGMNYVYSNDPTTLQLYQATSMQVQYPLSIEQVIDQIFVPYGNSINRKITKTYPLNQITDFYKNFDALLFKVDQNPKQIKALGIEWIDPDGTKWLTVLHHYVEQASDHISWGYAGSAIGAPSAYFDEAKINYLNGLINRQINPQWISTMNQQTEYTIRKSNEAHAQREAAFIRGMEERQKQYEANLASRERNQKQWEASQDANAQRQERISDYILGKTNVKDPNTGERYKIDPTNDHYWINTHGEYVGSDNYKYDPNKDDFINNRTWNKLKMDNWD